MFLKCVVLFNAGHTGTDGANGSVGPAGPNGEPVRRCAQGHTLMVATRDCLICSQDEEYNRSLAIDRARRINGNTDITLVLGLVLQKRC